MPNHGSADCGELVLVADAVPDCRRPDHCLFCWREQRVCSCCSTGRQHLLMPSAGNRLCRLFCAGKTLLLHVRSHVISSLAHIAAMRTLQAYGASFTDGKAAQHAALTVVHIVHVT